MLLTMLPCLSGSDAVPVFAGLLRSDSDELPARLLMLRVPRYLARNTRMRDQPRGLALEPVEHPDDDSVAYVSLRLTEPELGDLFAVLAYDIVETIAPETDSTSQLQAFLDRIAGWQELFGKVPTGGLGPQARQGLYGELFLMRRLLETGLTAESVAVAWAGPLREPQDFRFGTVALEAKTTSGTSQAIHISNAAQLDDAPLTALWLFHLALKIGSGTGETLPGLVADLAALLHAEPTAATHFQHRLQLAGYFHAQADLYATEGFTVSYEQTVRVAGSLPRLRASDLPTAISELSYAIDLTALVPHRRPFSDLIDSIS
ncbi:PD-(D/E)XK motif protein [Hymenobacter sp.]|uniref:PD-(D/E)XK motif protein n=1 Tax=Hymenobacter sp. TaxID=1898978 RepID=UPI002EDB116F